MIDMVNRAANMPACMGNILVPESSPPSVVERRVEELKPAPSPGTILVAETSYEEDSDGACSVSTRHFLEAITITEDNAQDSGLKELRVGSGDLDLSRDAVRLPSPGVGATLRARADTIFEENRAWIVQAANAKRKADPVWVNDFG